MNIRDITCRLDGDTVQIQIDEECHEFTRDEADDLYAEIAESLFQCEQEVVLKGMKMSGEEVYRLFDVMYEASAELCPSERY